MISRIQMALLIIFSVTAVVLLTVSSYIGAISGSADISTQEFDFDDFNHIEVGYAFEVDIARSDSYLVIITINDNLYDYLDVSEVGDTPRIRLKRNYLYANTTLKAAITLPALDRLELSGASTGKLNGFSSTKPIDFEISGASRANLGKFGLTNVDIDVSGASYAIVNASGQLDADLSGASHLTYLGSPTLGRINTSGISTISQG